MQSGSDLVNIGKITKRDSLGQSRTLGLLGRVPGSIDSHFSMKTGYSGKEKNMLYRVTRFGDISPLGQHFNFFWPFLE